MAFKEEIELWKHGRGVVKEIHTREENKGSRGICLFTIALAAILRFRGNLSFRKKKINFPESVIAHCSMTATFSSGIVSLQSRVSRGGEQIPFLPVPPLGWTWMKDGWPQDTTSGPVW